MADFKKSLPSPYCFFSIEILFYTYFIPGFLYYILKKKGEVATEPQI